jgi:hypothetical protein
LPRRLRKQRLGRPGEGLKKSAAGIAGERSPATGKRSVVRNADHQVAITKADTKEKAPADEKSNQGSTGRSIIIAASLVGQPLIRQLKRAPAASLQRG